ncbi:MAG: oligosaccharide flippase family protein [Candidatus Hydrogenedens sp.]|nr:oligosaccharide flippase family protein [Candidatus Hydrogenedens sp.]
MDSSSLASRAPSPWSVLASRVPWRPLFGLAGQVFVSGTNFGTGVLLARFAGKEQYGHYFLGFTLLVYMVELQNALISTPYMVYAPRMDEAERRRYAGSALAHQGAAMAAATVLFLFAAACSAAGLLAPNLLPVLFLLAATGGFFMLRDQVRRFCFAHMQMGAAFLCDIAVAALQLGGLALLAWSGALTALSAYGVIAVACGITALGWLFWARAQFEFDRSDFAPSLRRNWQFGRWVFASAVVWGLSMNFYPWILNRFHGAEAAGLWGACFTVVMLGNILLMGVTNYLGPRIAALYAEDGLHAMRAFVWRSNLFFALPLGALCVFLWFFGRPLLVAIYGEEFAPAAGALTVLSVNLLALALAFAFSRGLFAMERADLDFKINFVPLVCLVALGIPLTWYFGLAGAAAGLCAANCAALCCRAAAFAYAAPRPEGSA